MSPEQKTLLQVKNLKKYFPVSRQFLSSQRRYVKAVDDVSFDVREGETLGLVGETGCGKTTVARTILQLYRPTSGQVLFDGVDLASLQENDLRKMRRRMQIIFQDPFSSLDPKKTINQIISEPISENKIIRDKRKREDRVLELMETVGLAERLINTYPHELDGGRRQRIGIARALAMEPKLIVCDEPVSALDVSIQAQILNLLKELQEKIGLTYIFITHDLSVVNHFSDEIMIMYLGQIVEKAPTEELFTNPIHPYTKALLSAIPIPSLSEKRQRISLKGEITSPINLPDECRFAPRCYECVDHCRSGIPPLVEVNPGHFVACFEHV
mgnify:CR=1 FL=1